MGKYYENEVTPYNDIYMTYSDKTHSYTLTEHAADEISKGVTGKSFLLACGSEDREKYKRKEYSSDMYKYIGSYNRRDERKRRVDEHRLAKNGDLRDYIQDAMSDMLRADLRSGFSIQKDLSWVNPERGSVIDLSSVPSIAPDAIEGLFASGILFKGEYSYKIDDDDYRDDY